MGNNKTQKNFIRKRLNLRLYCRVALFAAMIAIFSQIAFPVGAIPISLGTLGVFICAVILPDFWGTICMTLYVFLGIAGLPMFYGFGSLSALIGPTGGFIVGYIPATAIISTVCRILKKRTFITLAFAMTSGLAVIYTLGFFWYFCVSEGSPSVTITSMLPVYLPFDILKICLASAVCLKLKNILRH